MRRSRIALTTLALTLLAPLLLEAQIPRRFSYQGEVTDANGSPLTATSATITVALYTDAFGGSPIYSETQTVPLASGIFSMILGQAREIPDSIALDRPLFLGVSIDGGPELSPRTPMTAAPQAIEAARAEMADQALRLAPGAPGVVTSINGGEGELQLQGGSGINVSRAGSTLTISADNEQPWSLTGTNVWRVDGNVGIGTSTPSAKLEVEGTAKASRLQMTTGAASGRLLMSDGQGLALWTDRIAARSNDIVVEQKLGVHLPDTVAPDATLHVAGNYSGFNPVATRTAVLENRGEVSLSLRSDSGRRHRIYFDRPVGDVGAMIQCDSSLVVIGKHRFTTINGTSQSYRFYFDNDGARLGIGRYPSDNDLEVNGTASKSTAGDWLANSDRRIKTGIRTIDNASATIMRLRPVTFEYTEEWRARHPEIAHRRYYNVIAQEYREVFPDAVKGSGEYLDGDPDELLQVDTYDAQIVTIRALQELIEENRRLRERIDRLEEQVGASRRAEATAP